MAIYTAIVLGITIPLGVVCLVCLALVILVFCRYNNFQRAEEASEKRQYTTGRRLFCCVSPWVSDWGPPPPSNRLREQHYEKFYPVVEERPGWSERNNRHREFSWMPACRKFFGLGASHLRRKSSDWSVSRPHPRYSSTEDSHGVDQSANRTNVVPSNTAAASPKGSDAVRDPGSLNSDVARVESLEHDPLEAQRVPIRLAQPRPAYVHAPTPFEPLAYRSPESGVLAEASREEDAKEETRKAPEIPAMAASRSFMSPTSQILSDLPRTQASTEIKLSPYVNRSPYQPIITGNQNQSEATQSSHSKNSAKNEDGVIPFKNMMPENQALSGDELNFNNPYTPERIAASPSQDPGNSSLIEALKKIDPSGDNSNPMTPTMIDVSKSFPSGTPTPIWAQRSLRLPFASPSSTLRGLGSPISSLEGQFKSPVKPNCDSSGPPFTPLINLPSSDSEEVSVGPPVGRLSTDANTARKGGNAIYSSLSDSWRGPRMSASFGNLHLVSRGVGRFVNQRVQPRSENPSKRLLNSPESAPAGELRHGVVKSLGGAVFRAVSEYSPSLPDELPLELGETVYIFEVYDDGWCYCESITYSPRAGMCPMSCFERA